MTVSEDEVIVAHRIGSRTTRRSQPMLVRCGQELRDQIFKFTHNLKGIKNKEADYYYVNQQLLEPRATEKRERDEKLRSIRKANEQIPEEQKHKRVSAHIKNNMLYVNNIPQKKHIYPPTVQDVFNCDRETRDRINGIKFVHTGMISNKGSHFRGHATHVRNSKDVNAVYIKLHQLYPESDHLILAYSVKSYTGHHDHGEHTAGSKILQILLQKKMNNVAVFVTWDYGGIHIGQRRFLHIEKCARDALDALIDVR